MSDNASVRTLPIRRAEAPAIYSAPQLNTVRLSRAHLSTFVSTRDDGKSTQVRDCVT